MTVQELINKLSVVKNKKMRVVYPQSPFGDSDINYTGARLIRFENDSKGKELVFVLEEDKDQ